MLSAVASLTVLNAPTYFEVKTSAKVVTFSRSNSNRPPNAHTGRCRHPHRYHSTHPLLRMIPDHSGRLARDKSHRHHHSLPRLSEPATPIDTALLQPKSLARYRKRPRTRSPSTPTLVAKDGYRAQKRCAHIIFLHHHQALANQSNGRLAVSQQLDYDRSSGLRIWVTHSNTRTGMITSEHF